MPINHCLLYSTALIELRLVFSLFYRQEGWRLEHADVKDKESPIIFKGVVFNEMKGVFVS